VTWLAALLFLPWFLLLALLFWRYPRQPRNAARRRFDSVALLFAAGGFLIALEWAHAHADRSYGAMWPQVLATSVGYAAFLAATLAAFLLRRAWLRRR
jgi:hypothetical protein